MAHICQVHPYEAAEGLCRSCGGPFCADCLVYPFGPTKPPYCVPCAVTAAGVRKSARNPTVVVPKENKRRLKEWRKARKRDLDSPPPDGVATWQKMDDADTAMDAEAADEQAAAEREALRLPPPEPETLTPPPGVNLAPPGPAGSDWRDEIDAPAATNFGPPGSGLDTPSGMTEPTPLAVPGENALGAGRAEEDPGTDLGVEPVHASSLPAPSGGGVYPTPAFDPTAFAPPPVEPTRYEPSQYEPAPVEPTPFRPTGFDPSQLSTEDQAAPETPAAATPFQPTGLDPTQFGTEDQGAPAPGTAGSTFDSPPAAATPNGSASAFDAPPAPPGTDHRTYEPPLPPDTGQPAFEPPPPPAPDPRAFEPPPPAVPAPPAVVPAAGPVAPVPTRPSPDIARSAIRPPTPTRIPAGGRDATRTEDAKSMLARIAALRGEQEDES